MTGTTRRSASSQRLHVPVRLDVREGRAPTSSAPGSPAIGVNIGAAPRHPVSDRRSRPTDQRTLHPLPGPGSRSSVGDGHAPDRRPPPPRRGGGPRPDVSFGSVPAHGLRADRRAAPGPGDRARLHRQRDRRARARERSQRALRPRAGGQDRRTGLPGRDRSPRVRRRRARLSDLRPDRGGDRPRRLGDAHRGVGADLAGLLGDRALGHRGAEAALSAQAVLGRVAGLLRADRARHRLRRGQPAHAREARPTPAG